MIVALMKRMILINILKMRYKLILIFIIAMLSLQDSKAQMYVKDILNDKIPVAYTGKLLQAFEYKDNAGLHLFLLSRKKEQYKVTIYGSCYTQINGSYVKDWGLTDFSDQNLLVYYTHTKIVDIDDDGIYENIFVYQLKPDEQSGDWKVMLHYKNQKYAVRAHIPRFGEEQFGADKSSLISDKSIEALPSSVKKYVMDYWNDVADRNELSINFQ
jgi:hypothetical protein